MKKTTPCNSRVLVEISLSCFNLFTQTNLSLSLLQRTLLVVPKKTPHESSNLIFDKTIGITHVIYIKKK